MSKWTVERRAEAGPGLLYDRDGMDEFAYCSSCSARSSDVYDGPEEFELSARIALGSTEHRKCRNERLVLLRNGLDVCEAASPEGLVDRLLEDGVAVTGREALRLGILIERSWQGGS